MESELVKMDLVYRREMDLDLKGLMELKLVALMDWIEMDLDWKKLKRELLVEILAMHHVPADSYAIKSGNCWCFVDCWKLSESQVVQLYENLKPVCS